MERSGSPGDVVLAGPDRVKAERTNKAHLLQRFGEPTGRIIACRVLRVQVDAKLQCHAPPSCRVRATTLSKNLATHYREGDSEMARHGR